MTARPRSSGPGARCRRWRRRDPRPRPPVGSSRCRLPRRSGPSMGARPPHSTIVQTAERVRPPVRRTGGQRAPKVPTPERLRRRVPPSPPGGWRGEAPLSPPPDPRRARSRGSLEVARRRRGPRPGGPRRGALASVRGGPPRPADRPRSQPPRGVPRWRGRRRRAPPAIRLAGPGAGAARRRLSPPPPTPRRARPRAGRRRPGSPGPARLPRGPGQAPPTAGVTPPRR